MGRRQGGFGSTFSDYNSTCSLVSRAWFSFSLFAFLLPFRPPTPPHSSSFSFQISAFSLAFPLSALTALCSRKAVPPCGSRYRVIYRACSHRLGLSFIFHFLFIIFHFPPAPPPPSPKNHLTTYIYRG